MSSTPRQLRSIFALGLLLFVVGVLAITAYALWRARADAVVNGLQVAKLHAHSFESFLTQSLRVSEQTAANLVPAADAASDPVQQQRIFATALQHTPFMRSLSLLDKDGRIVVSSNPANVGLTLDTGSYLPPATEHIELLRIGQPWSGRDFANGHATSPEHPGAPDAPGFIPVTRTVRVGERALRLLIAINPDYFISHIEDTLGAQAGTVDILRYDGLLLMGSAAGVRTGTPDTLLAPRLSLATTEAGSLELKDSAGRVTLSAFRASALYPFVVITHLDRTVALGAWRDGAQTLLGALTPLLLLLLLLGSGAYRRQAEAARQREEAERLLRLNATVFESSSEAILITDAQANILSVNPAFEHITGYSETDVRARNPRLLASGQHDAAFYIRLWNGLLQTGAWRGEISNRRKDGSVFDAHLSITVSRDGQGQLQHYVGVMEDITERKQVRLARDAALKRLHRLAARVPGFLYEYHLRPDGTSCFPYASDAITPMFGGRLRPNDVQSDASALLQLVHRQDWPAVLASLQVSAAEQTAWRQEYRVVFDDGSVRWQQSSAVPERQLDGSVLWHGLALDITERKDSEARLQLAASVFSHSREGIMITRIDGTIIDVNEAFSHITGYSRAEIIGQNPRVLNSGRQDPVHYSAMWSGLHTQGHWCGEVWNRRKNGEVYAELLTISTVHDAQGQPQHYVALFSDITVAKTHEQQLEHIAHYDTLTSLPNRVLLADRLSQSMAQALRRGLSLAVIFIDLDGFKAVNDTHGHQAGDSLLMTIAGHMKQSLREGDTLARIGGDEFVAVLVDLTTAAECLPVVNRLLHAAAEPMQFGGARLQVSASLGVTLYPQDSDIDADQLQRQADQAMYQAKVSGKNRYHFFDTEHDRSVRVHHESLERIARALSAGEFVLHYQPKVNMRSGRVIGVEALIRWNHPEQGLLAPAMFLPTIENHPLSVPLGEWVMHHALQQISLWRDLGLDMAVSVNVGARQLQQANFVTRLQGILAAHPDVAATQLELEVLETSALEDIAGVAGIIEACRALGVSFALDDFGTGYASLTYLKHLPVAMLKIDQSFVRDMLGDPDDMAILQGVIGLAQAFQRDIIAEGVETPEHGRTLLGMGCDLAQGYGIARPMPAGDVPYWVQRWHHQPPWSEPPAAANGL